jgi:ribosome-associated toxin RatA of RatAB toxin-antitoxin module
MRTMEMHARVPEMHVDDVFDRIADFERYPEMTDAVRQVKVTAGAGGALVSEWEVAFRDGILRWSEEDEIDRAARTIRFRMLDGDFDQFTGEWSVESDGDATLVSFRSRFDLGMPTLAFMLDPIAENALRENIARILTGLLGEAVELPAPRGLHAAG